MAGGNSLVAQLRKYDWRLLVYVAALFGAIVSAAGGDTTQTLIFFLGIPALALTFILLLLCAAVGMYRRQCLWIAGAIGVFFASSAALIAYQRGDPQSLRTTVRWKLQARHYKAAVLSQGQAKPGELKHIEWDGWGFAGAGETTMYLVYDPSDSLLNFSKERVYRLVSGIPCPLDRVHRLETHWYTVLFPTDSRWGDCTSSSLATPSSWALKRCCRK